MKDEKETDRYILSIEDNPDDFEIISRSLRKVAPDRVIRQCQSGDEALTFLHLHGDPAATPEKIGLPYHHPARPEPARHGRQGYSEDDKK